MGNLMARKGIVPADSSGYGYYDVRLREGLRQYLAPDTSLIDTTQVFGGDDEMMPPQGMQDQSKNLFDRLFGTAKKPDSVKPAIKIDSPAKTKQQLRQERREQRRREKENGGDE